MAATGITPITGIPGIANVVGLPLVVTDVRAVLTTAVLGTVFFGVEYFPALGRFTGGWVFAAKARIGVLRIDDHRVTGPFKIERWWTLGAYLLGTVNRAVVGTATGIAAVTGIPGFPWIVGRALILTGSRTGHLCTGNQAVVGTATGIAAIRRREGVTRIVGLTIVVTGGRTGLLGTAY